MKTTRRLTVSETKIKESNHKDLAQDVETLKQEIVNEVVEKFQAENQEPVNRKIRHNGVEEVRLGDEPVLWLYGYVVEDEDHNVKIKFNYTRSLTLPEDEEAKEFWTQAPMGTFGT